MLRGSQLGGAILVCVGAVTLLGALTSIPLIPILLAAALIGAGIWIISGAARGRGPLPREQASIPLEGATEAALKIRHGAGRLAIGAGAGPGDLLSGTFGGGLDAVDDPRRRGAARGHAGEGARGRRTWRVPCCTGSSTASTGTWCSART